eukprot:CAMPEP_0116913558 /NCGR_PEP_ID=MMETSP0467-20121206/16775_1 /TAXON_ID=283647 /ORGANISM="Mesodinium pulex, Strain SPMC105" /LENGTH=100 /DNA_ID=CAMNT_0004589795 /DNA_START=398 /DNA_END=700 /DNA_ORIENTATION=+
MPLALDSLLLLAGYSWGMFAALYVSAKSKDTDRCIDQIEFRELEDFSKIHEGDIQNKANGGDVVDQLNQHPMSTQGQSDANANVNQVLSAKPHTQALETN